VVQLKDIHTDKIPFVSGWFYHVFNKGNNKDNIFFNEANYKYFLQKFDQYLSKYIDTYTFCLLPNHFHILIRVKGTKSRNTQEDNAKKHLKQKLKNHEKSEEINQTIIQQFSNFFNSYTKSINKQQDRNGSLFKKHFKRKIILDKKYLSHIVFYIHLNPIYHKITDDYENYKWSSYWRILEDRPTKLQKEALLNYFNGKEAFSSYHQRELQMSQEIEKYWME